MDNVGLDLNTINLDEMKESKATFVFGQMNEPPGARARVALSGLTIAEYFRDGDGEGRPPGLPDLYRGYRVVSSVGRALRLHRRCREFEPLTTHQSTPATSRA